MVKLGHFGQQIRNIKYTSIFLSAATPTSAAMKFYDGTEWIVLSGKADITSSLTDQPTVTEEPNAKVIIGRDTTAADGVLVL